MHHDTLGFMETMTHDKLRLEPAGVEPNDQRAHLMGIGRMGKGSWCRGVAWPKSNEGVHLSSPVAHLSSAWGLRMFEVSSIHGIPQKVMVPTEPEGHFVPQTGPNGSSWSTFMFGMESARKGSSRSSPQLGSSTISIYAGKMPMAIAT